MVMSCWGGRASSYSVDPAFAQKARPLSSVTFDFVLSDFSCQCVPVNVEYLRCLALVAAASGKRGLKELLLKFLQGFVETNFLLQHFSHESIQYFFSHDAAPKRTAATILLQMEVVLKVVPRRGWTGLLETGSSQSVINAQSSARCSADRSRARVLAATALESPQGKREKICDSWTP